MLTTLDWETVKEFYKENFGIDGWVVEMYASMDILSLCVSGASNETISNFLEIPQDEVKKVIRQTFEFDGWEEDLPVNPYKLYQEGLREYPQHLETRFISEMEMALLNKGTNKYWMVHKSYWICRAMEDIERKIEDEWI